jgi:hypothetical protein
MASASLHALAAPVLEGSGTAGNPYKITSCFQLHNLLNDAPGTVIVNTNYLIKNDLDCTGYTFNNTVQLIGTTIDGGKHKITNITLGEYGFVYQMDNSKIKNLWLASGDNSAAPYFYGGSFANKMTTGSELNNVKSSLKLDCSGLCGGLVSVAQDSTITKAVFDGEINQGSYSGGLVGSDFEGGTNNLIISQSAFLGKITTPAYGGGIIGSYASNVDIINSYVNGDMDLGGYSGGLIGSFNNNINILNSYTAGANVPIIYTGGIIGGSNNSYVTVSHSFTLLNPTNSDSNTGNVEGPFNSNIVYNDVHYQDDSNSGRCVAGNPNAVSGCSKMTLAQTDSTINALGWDLTTIWEKTIGLPPTLRNVPDFTVPTENNNQNQSNNTPATTSSSSSSNLNRLLFSNQDNGLENTPTTEENSNQTPTTYNSKNLKEEPPENNYDKSSKNRGIIIAGITTILIITTALAFSTLRPKK